MSNQSAAQELYRIALPQFLNLDPDTIPETDNPIINDQIYKDDVSTFGKPTRQQLWFARNIVLVLGTGVIVTDHQTEIVRIILEYLSPMQNTTLLNRYMLADYNHPTLKKLDGNKTIHGNYLLVLHILVDANADIHSIDCPEKYYARHGLIDTKYDDSVLDYFAHIIRYYAFSRKVLPKRPQWQDPRIVDRNKGRIQPEPTKPAVPTYVNDLQKPSQTIDNPAMTDYIEDAPPLPGGQKTQQAYNAKYAQNNSLFARAFKPTNANVPLLGMYKPALTAAIAPRMTISTESQFMTEKTGQMFQ